MHRAASSVISPVGVILYIDHTLVHRSEGEDAVDLLTFIRLNICYSVDWSGGSYTLSRNSNMKM